MTSGCECLPGELNGAYQYIFELEDENDRLRRLLFLLVSADPPSLEVPTISAMVEAGRVVI